MIKTTYPDLPKILCPNEIRLRPYEKKFKVECAIHSYPSIEKSQIAWFKVNSGKLKFTLPSNKSMGIYQLTEVMWNGNGLK